MSSEAGIRDVLGFEKWINEEFPLLRFFVRGWVEPYENFENRISEVQVRARVVLDNLEHEERQHYQLFFERFSQAHESRDTKKCAEKICEFYWIY